VWVPSFRGVALLFLVVSCSSQDSSPLPDAGSRQADADTSSPAVEAGATEKKDKANLRVVAANTTSGKASTYDSGEGIRFFQGLKPDLALIQEFKYGANTDDDLKKFVTEAFGADYSYYREDMEGEVKIPNGIVSRYKILQSGHWVDPEVRDRSFAYAKLDVPGPHALWAVSLHLVTASSTRRTNEATALVEHLKEVVAEDDFLVLGGDLNTGSRGEACLGKLGELVDTKATPPADQDGNDNTNGPRKEPYDWVLPSPSLAAHRVPTVIGTNSFEAGLVFDSRVYTPLTDVAPVAKEDSSALNMQHMPVVKDFALPE
jgi:endonuclease/exonuclease/phosphatase family metal-dependent hydrolase